MQQTSHSLPQNQTSKILLFLFRASFLLLSASMVHSQYLKNAVLCVKHLQKTNVRDDQLFKEPHNASVAATLSAMSHWASFLENSINRNVDLCDIDIIVSCIVKKGSSRASPAAQRTFNIWNNTKSQPRIPRMTDDRNQALGEIRTENENTQTSEEISRRLLVTESSRRVESPGRNESPVRNESPGNIDTPGGGAEYRISVEVASQCLQLLLDGSGFTSHRCPTDRSSYSEVNSKALIDVLQIVFEKEKDIRLKALLRSRDDESNSTNSTRPYSSSSNNMIYMDLLPDHLRCEDSTNGVMVSVPDLRIEYNCSNRTARMMRVRLRVRKPDRNKKNQNFALVCALLQSTGPAGICAKVLREYASEGLSEKGCDRRMKFCASSKSLCGGFANCKFAKKTLTLFYRRLLEPAIGKGKVDPFIKNIDGKSITDGFYAVRFGLLNREILKQASDTSPQERKENDLIITRWLKYPVVWDKNLIERVDVFGDYEIVGTAILVEEHLFSRTQGSVLQETTSNVGFRAQLDFSNAAIICDFRYKEGTATSIIRYPYAEWYHVPSLRGMKAMHFEDSLPPSYLDEQSLSKTAALLWHRDKYKVRREP